MARVMLGNAEVDLSQAQHLAVTVLDAIRGQRERSTGRIWGPQNYRIIKQRVHITKYLFISIIRIRNL